MCSSISGKSLSFLSTFNKYKHNISNNRIFLMEQWSSRQIAYIAKPVKKHTHIYFQRLCFRGHTKKRHNMATYLINTMCGMSTSYIFLNCACDIVICVVPRGCAYLACKLISSPFFLVRCGITCEDSLL